MSSYERFDYPVPRHEMSYAPNAVQGSDQYVALRSEDVIVLMHKVLIQGVSKNGNPWKRWSDLYRLTVSTRGRGKGPRRLNYYCQSYQPGSPANKAYNRQFKNVTALFATTIAGNLPSYFLQEIADLYNRWQGTDINKDYFLQKAGSRVRANHRNIDKLAYPILKEKCFDEVRGIKVANPNISLALRQNDTKKFFEMLFGKSNYRRSFASSMSGCTMDQISTYSSLRNIVPVDWIIEAMRATPKLDKEDNRRRFPTGRDFIYPYNVSRELSSNRKLLTSLFSKFTRPTARKMVLNIAEDKNNYFDSLSMYDMLEKSNTLLDNDLFKVSTWRELHDVLTVEQRKIKTANKEIPQTKYHQKLEASLKNTGLEIKPAKNTHELISWSREMSNCISSYASKAVSGDTILLGLYKQEELIANLEIGPNKALRQFLGKRNQSVDEDIFDVVIDNLTEKKLVTRTEGAWI